MNIVCKNTLMHPRREKHAIISTNGQQNRTITGIKLEEVFSFKTRKDLKGVRLKAFLLTVSMVSEVKGLARLSSFSSTMTLLAIWMGLRIGVINKLISSSWTLPRPLTRFHTGGYCTN